MRDDQPWLQHRRQRGRAAFVAAVYADLLNAALGSVDWYENAAHYVDEHVDEVFAALSESEVIG